MRKYLSANTWIDQGELWRRDLWGFIGVIFLVNRLDGETGMSESGVTLGPDGW
jgi:hypothetical protein